MTAAAVVVKVDDQRRRVYIYRGGTLPPSTSAGEADRLLRRGMIRLAEGGFVADVPTPAEPAPEPEQAEPEQAESEPEQVEPEPVSSRKPKAAPAASE